MEAKHCGRRGVVAIAAATLAITGLADPSDGARDVSQACPPDTPEDGFVDTGPDGSPVESAVDCLVAYGVATGTSATTYSPAPPVRREQMASFLARLLETADGFTAPPPGPVPGPFQDTGGSVHAASIDLLAQLDITLGTSPGRFSPGDPVSRGAMASFLVRVLEQLGSDLPVVTFDEFDDDEESVHEDAINTLASLGLADGVSAATYAPQAPVTRQQMALFLTRTLDHLVEDEGLVAPPV